MEHPCYRMLPNMKQPVSHLLSVVPARPVLQSSHYSVLRGKRVLRSIQCTKLDTKQRSPPVEKFFEVEMTVRDSDVDKYGVVANTVYAEYIDKGREMVARVLGINSDTIAERGRALATSELNLKYFAPMRGGSKFVVKSRVLKIKGVRLFLEHIIETLPDRKVVVKATATVVCLNEQYRPTRVFPELSTKLLHLSSEDADLS